MPKPDLTGAATGAIGGATTGAKIGGPWGALAGGIFGGGAGLFGGKKKKKRSSLDKNQKRLNQQQYQGLEGEGPLADLYNYDPEMANEVFDKTVVNPSYRKFKEELVPGITGQFRNQGLMTSSYAGDAISKLARDVQENLDAQRSQYLYGEQKDARNAKRAAVENLQNRSTFAYDKAGGGGFDINKVLDSIPEGAIDQLRDYFNSKKDVAA